MDTDGTRSTDNQHNQQNEHKAARILLAPLIWLEKGLSALLKKALGANYADVTEDEVNNWPEIKFIDVPEWLTAKQIK